MVLDNLGKSIRNTLKKIARASTVDEKLVKEVVRDLQRALLTADVNVKLALKLTKEVERRALNEEPPAGKSAREHVIRIIYEEMVEILGEAREIPLKKHRILMVGLYGQGKTTTSGKLANYFKKRGLSVGLIAGDVHRPAAYDQLKQIGDMVDVPVYGRPGEKKAPKIVREGLEEFKHTDVVIIDTSGRHSLEDDLIKEIKLVGKVAKADEIFLVLDAAVGQQAGPQAKAFHDAVGVTGVVLTKLDGSAKGGGALSAVAETGAPIVFIGTGEHMEDLEKFDPARFISRLLGMGDIKALMETASEVMDEEDAEELAKRLMSGKFNLIDMYNQMEAMTKMGPLKKVFSMLGFVDRMSDEEVEALQRKLRDFRIIMDSMTREELENPKMIKSSRIKRIARGSGMGPDEVRALLKHYNQSKKAIKGFSGNRKLQRQLMKQLESGNLKM